MPLAAWASSRLYKHPDLLASSGLRTHNQVGEQEGDTRTLPCCCLLLAPRCRRACHASGWPLRHHATVLLRCHGHQQPYFCEEGGCAGHVCLAMFDAAAVWSIVETGNEACCTPPCASVPLLQCCSHRCLDRSRSVRSASKEHSKIHGVQDATHLPAVGWRRVLERGGGFRSITTEARIRQLRSGATRFGVASRPRLRYLTIRSTRPGGSSLDRSLSVTRSSRDLNCGFPTRLCGDMPLTSAFRGLRTGGEETYRSMPSPNRVFAVARAVDQAHLVAPIKAPSTRSREQDTRRSEQLTTRPVSPYSARNVGK